MSWALSPCPSLLSNALLSTKRLILSDGGTSKRSTTASTAATFIPEIGWIRTRHFCLANRSRNKNSWRGIYSLNASESAALVTLARRATCAVTQIWKRSEFATRRSITPTETTHRALTTVVAAQLALAGAIVGALALMALVRTNKEEKGLVETH